MRKKKTKRYGTALLFILVLFVMWIWEGLIAKGYEWETVCQGEGRVYRLRSTDRGWLKGSGNGYRRALHFLGADGETRHYTDRYVWRSRQQDGVWRFRYNPEDEIFFGVEDPAAVLYGDEQTIEIAVSLDRMFLVRKAAPPLTLPCVAKKKPKYEARN